MPLALPGPSGAVFLDLGDAGMSLLVHQDVADLLRFGDLVPLRGTGFGGGDGYATISAGKEAVYFCARGRGYVIPAHWLIGVAEFGKEEEIREIQDTTGSRAAIGVE